MHLGTRALPLLHLLGLLLPLSPPAPELLIEVRNHLSESRSAVTLELDLHQLNLTAAPERLRVREQASGRALISQLLDEDGDQTWDKLLCQVDLRAQDRRHLIIAVAPASEAVSSAEVKAFSRLAPERIDDYAWENDLVAFRTYGPKAQQLTEAGSPDGTLSSGMDCWLKRVPYPIIDKWYAGHVRQPGYFYQDHGEGYDPYHVGASRGCGGVGVWHKADSSLAVSKNFVSYKTLATGPIRTVFELTYAPWPAGGQLIQERKRITLDAGSPLSRYEVFTTVDHGSVPPLTVGITLHEQKGTVAGRPTEGWVRHWEPLDDSELGTALLAAPGQIQDWWTYRTARKDQSHVFLRFKPTAHLTYYAGYGWTKAGRFSTARAWEDYLARTARQLASPVEVSVLHASSAAPQKRR